MIPNKGLYLDTNPITQPEGTWYDAKNILFNKKKGAITSDLGTLLVGVDYPHTEAKPIGSTSFPDRSVVIYSDGINGGLDRLGILNIDKTYTDIIVDNLLGFNKDYPIRSSEFDYNFKKERIIAFTDKNQIPKIINIDNLGISLDVNKALVNASDINKFSIFPSFNTPVITTTILNSGGSILSGTYSFCFAYKNNDGTRTSYTPVSNICYIVEDTTTDPLSYDGTVPGQLTSKAIQINLTNIDISYGSLILIGVSTINGQKRAFEIKEERITSSTSTITYLGSEVTTEIDLEEILTPRPVYNKTAAMVKINNILYHGNLESQEDIDFQSIANNIKIYYNSKLVSVNDIGISQTPTFAHGEVYAFYIVFVLKNGSLSKAFHIPGRAKIPGEGPIDPHLSVSYDNVSGSYYQIGDTTNRGGGTYTTTSGTIHLTSLGANSNMGFWENENEFYPDNFPSLAGEKVRHHVFPTYRECKTRHYPADTEYLKSKLDILGIDVNNVNIPSDIQSQISGYYITYAKKDYQDCINYGLDLLQLSGRDSNTSDTREIDLPINAYFNMPIDGGPLGGAQSIYPSNRSFRSRLLDLMKDKPQLSTNNLYIKYEARLRYFGEILAGGANTRDNDDFISNNNHGFVYLMDYINRPFVTGTGQSGVKIDFPNPNNSQAIQKINEFKYIPSGVNDGDIQNTKGSEFLYLKPNSALSLPGFSFKEIFFGFTPSGLGPFGARFNSILGTLPAYGFPMGNEPHATNLIEETYLYSLRQVKSNVHSLYNQQLLTICSNLILPNISLVEKINGTGDRFIGPLNVMSIGSSNRNSNYPDKFRALAIKNFLVESRYNTRLRYEVAGNNNTKYYPKTKASAFYNDTADQITYSVINFELGTNSNDLSGINADYKQRSDYNQTLIDSPALSQITTNQFPYRVIKSAVAGTNSNGLNSWKTYLSADVFESNRDRGEIENLANLDDVLLIHHKYGLFRTIGTEKLSLETTEVFLGTGDIFGQEPKEIIPSKLGYLGTQNIFACCNFKGGYSWWDQNTGRVFLLTANGVIEISNLGLYNFFRDNSKISNSFPNNPYDGESLIATYDIKFNRLIFCKKSNTNPFTISYDVDNNWWASFHDYVPNGLFFTNQGFYGFKNNKIYEFNNELTKAKYFEGSIQPSYIEVVHNQYERDTKIYFNLNWKSEFFDNLGNFVKDKTITSIRVKNNLQDTGEITLVPHQDFNNKGNIRVFRDRWNFNKFKDSNVDPFKKKPIVGNYAIIKFTFDNAANLDSSQNSLYLYDLDVSIRKSEF